MYGSSCLIDSTDGSSFSRWTGAHLGTGAGEMPHHWDPFTCLSLTWPKRALLCSLLNLPAASWNLAVALVPHCWGPHTSPGFSSGWEHPLCSHTRCSHWAARHAQNHLLQQVLRAKPFPKAAISPSAERMTSLILYFFSFLDGSQIKAQPVSMLQPPGLLGGPPGSFLQVPVSCPGIKVSLHPTPWGS